MCVSWAHHVIVIGAGLKKELPHQLTCSKGGVMPSLSPAFCHCVMHHCITFLLPCFALVNHALSCSLPCCLALLPEPP